MSRSLNMNNGGLLLLDSKEELETMLRISNLSSFNQRDTRPNSTVFSFVLSYAFDEVHFCVDQAKLSVALNVLKKYATKLDITTKLKPLWDEWLNAYKKTPMGQEVFAPPAVVDDMATWHILNDKGVPMRVNQGELEKHIALVFRFFFSGDNFFLQNDSNIYELSDDLYGIVKNHIYTHCRKDSVITSIVNMMSKDSKYMRKPHEINLSDPRYIRFSDGLFNPYENTFYKGYDEENFDTMTTAVSYENVSQAVNPTEIDTFLDSFFRCAEDKQSFLEYVGLLMTIDLEPEQFMILVGRGGSGKTTLGHVVQTILGQDGYSSLSLDELSFDKFRMAQLVNKFANIQTDDHTSRVDDEGVSVLDKLVSTEPTFSPEAKNVQCWVAKQTCRFLFVCNNVPEFADTSNDIKHRLIILRSVDHDYREKNTDTGLKARLTSAENVNRLAYLAMNATVARYQRENETKSRRIFVSANSKDEAVKMLEESDGVVAFITDRIKEIGGKNEILISDLYEEYRKYCEENGIKPLIRKKMKNSLANRGIYPKPVRTSKGIVYNLTLF